MHQPFQQPYGANGIILTFINEKTESLSGLWIWKFLWFQMASLLHPHACPQTSWKDEIQAHKSVEVPGAGSAQDN